VALILWKFLCRLVRAEKENAGFETERCPLPFFLLFFFFLITLLAGHFGQFENILEGGVVDWVANFIRKAFQFRKLLAMKFTTRIL
jgi:hypothetical protein